MSEDEEKKPRGRKPLVPLGEAVDKAIELMSNPTLDLLIPSQAKIGKALGKTKSISTITRTRGGKDGLHAAVTERLGRGESEIMLRRTGGEGPDLELIGERLIAAVNEMAKPRSGELIAELVHDFAVTAFDTAYKGSLGSGITPEKPGSSHRLRNLMLACHLDPSVRTVLNNVLSVRVEEYKRMVIGGLEVAGLSTHRDAGELVDEIAALLDGFLIRAVASGEGARWGEAFATSIKSIIATNLHEPITGTTTASDDAPKS